MMQNEDRHISPQQSWLNSGHQQIHDLQLNQKSIKHITINDKVTQIKLFISYLCQVNYLKKKN